MVAHNKAIDKQSLKGLSPLGKLTPDKINDIVSKSRVENLPAGRIVFRQGEDDGQTIYLLSGQIELSTAGKTRKKTIKGKSVEAKFPIADKIPRPATVRTKTASSLLYIDSSLLEILLDENPSGEYEVTEIDIADHATDWIMRFLQSRAFLKLPTKNIQQVLMSMEEIHVEKGNTIVQQGGEGDYYYIIKHGCCVVSRHPAEKAEEVRLATLVEGDGFGEEALISNSKRNATVTMQESGTLMRLKKDDFLNLLVTPLIRNVHLNSLKSKLYKNASILDIRTRDEFKKGSLDQATHIPLSMMRLRIPTLDTGKQYLIYSDNKNNANAAVFLLSQHSIDCMVILGSVQQTTILSETPEENNKATSQNAKSPELKIVSNDSAPKQTKDVPSAKQQTSSQAPNKLKQEAEKLRLQAKIEAEQMLAEAKAIRLSAIQDASRLRDKIEKEETLRLRTELETTRNRAEAAIKKSEHLAEQIRQQAEQESSQIRQQALNEAEKIQEELNQLRKQEAQMKQQMETELLAIQHQAAEQARLEAEQIAEQAKMAAEQAAEEVRILALHDAEKARAIAAQEAQQAILAAEQARTTALREAEETRVAAEKAAADAKAVADRLTQEAQTIEKEAEQARLMAEQEAEAIRQAALQEANRIKQDALEESKKIKNTAPIESKTFISHDNVFNLDDELSPTIEPVMPYADEASVALKMAEEIKARLVEVEEQQIKNEQLTLQKPVKYKAEVRSLDGKIILESEKDIFVFKEPKKQPPEKLTIEKATEQISAEQSQQKHSSPHTDKAINELPSADSKQEIFNGLDLPTIMPDNNSFVDDEKPQRSVLAIAASIILVIMLSLVAYTTKIEINFTEVDALVNQDSIEAEEEKVKAQARTDFRKKISSIAKK